MNRHFPNSPTLINSLRDGKKEAYAQVVDMYYANLCQYAANLTRDSQSAGDIVQNVMIRLWERRNSLHPELNLKNYLYRSVYNEFVDQFRKEKALSTLEEKYIQELNSYQDEEGEERLAALLELVQREIEQLPEKYKQTFLLSRKEGLTYEEIAAFLKISVKTVETHMTKAFSILRAKTGERLNTLLFILFGSVSR
ncbi:RNA polymerase sigma factor [Robertkochia solimangrovi]|uniref:RNA polymerase sigma factor n=1 Tax=Robertkochia solimangrovi TaxID=2213046 RepID=UPI00118119C3|nr:RNA polymerase sigma-70 factor [Robertkochia solimangrovi]TRZ42443.1 RNA polymerase sigma-70 factor [Robertkochia solimangrovi]